MTPPTINCARSVRDGGIDAMAALNEAVRKALACCPTENAQELKLVFGQVMAEVVEKLINPAVLAFPELELDEAAWAHIATTKALGRSNGA
jgi:hypothetical protein